MMEVLFFGMILASGAFAVWPFRGAISSAWLGLLALPAGLGLWVLGSLALLITGLPFAPAYALTAHVLFTLGFFFLSSRRKFGDSSYPFNPGVCAGFLAAQFAVLIVFSWLHLAFMSNDSFFFLGVIRLMVSAQGITAFTGDQLGSWGVFVLLAQAPASWLSLDFFAALSPLLWFNLSVSLFVFLSDVLKRVGASGRERVFLVLLTAGAILTSYFYAFQFMYIHNNLPTALFFLYCCYFVWAIREERIKSADPLVWLCLVNLGLMRTEGPMIVTIVLVILAATSISKTRFVKITAALTGVLVAWYLRIYFSMSEGTHILTPTRALIVVMPLGGFAVASFLALRMNESWFAYLPKIMLGALAAGLALLTVVKFEHMITGYNNFIVNLTHSGSWGALGYAMIVLVILAFVRPRFTQGQKALAMILGSYLLLIFLMLAARIPYRFGTFDSANRMLLHIFPVLIVLIIPQFARRSTSQGYL